MPPVPVILRNALTRVRVWAIGLTSVVLSLIYFEGESYQDAISEAFHIPAGLIELSTAEKFIYGVMTLLSHHVVHVVLIVSLLPIFIGVVLMARQILKRTWKKMTPKWRFKITEWSARHVGKVRGWLGAPEFHFLTMPISAGLMLSVVFVFMTTSFALIDEGSKAGDDEANRLKMIAKRCSIRKGYIDEVPSCSAIQLKSGKQIIGLLFNTSGTNLFISDGDRTKVIDLGSVDSIADVPAITKRPTQAKR